MPAKRREVRSMVARIAANSRWAREFNPRAATEPARRGWDARFEREVDPEGVLPADERARRAARAKSAYFTRLALRSAEVRRQRQGGTPGVVPVDVRRHRRDRATPSPAPSRPGSAEARCAA